MHGQTDATSKTFANRLRKTLTDAESQQLASGALVPVLPGWQLLGRYQGSS